jgi:hypothetical protein
MKTEKQVCPICQQDVNPSNRYPNYICRDCSACATDATARLIGFQNASVNESDSGVQGFYCDTKEPYAERYFWIKGQKSMVREAHFGGVVYLLANDPWYGEQVWAQRLDDDE